MTTIPSSDLPVVYVIDRFDHTKSQYEFLTEQLQLQMHFATSFAEFAMPDNSRNLCCIVIDIDTECHERQLREFVLEHQSAGIPVILTTSDEQSQRAIDGLRYGAVALIPRPFPAFVLEDVLKFSMEQYKLRVAFRDQYEELQGNLEKLTVRQRQVLDDAAAGFPNKAIARKLEVSERTIEGERSEIMTAFDVETFSAVIFKFGAFRTLSCLRQLQKQEYQFRKRINTSTFSDDKSDHQMGRPDSSQALAFPVGVVRDDANRETFNS